MGWVLWVLGWRLACRGLCGRLRGCLCRWEAQRWGDVASSGASIGVCVRHPQASFRALTTVRTQLQVLRRTAALSVDMGYECGLQYAAQHVLEMALAHCRLVLSTGAQLAGRVAMVHCWPFDG